MQIDSDDKSAANYTGCTLIRATPEWIKMVSIRNARSPFGQTNSFRIDPFRGEFAPFVDDFDSPPTLSAMDAC